jgi:hypothetical protein
MNPVHQQNKQHKKDTVAQGSKSREIRKGRNACFSAGEASGQIYTSPEKKGPGQ